MRLLPAPRAVPRTGDQTPARSLARYVWRMSGAHQLWICLLALVVAGLSMVPLELQRRIINDVTGEADLRLLLVLGAAYLGVLVVQAATKYGLRVYQGWLSESAIRYNRQHLAGIHEYRVATVDHGAEGRAISIIGAELDKLGGFVGEALAQPCVNLGMMAAIGGYMLVVEPFVALFSLPFLLPQLVAAPLLQRLVNRLIEARVGMMRSLSDTIAGLHQDQGDVGETDLAAQLDGIYGNRIRIYLLKFALKALINFLNALAPLSALVVGGYLVMQGETTIGVVVAFVSGFERLSSPLRELMAYYRLAAQANVQHEMIARWM